MIPALRLTAALKDRARASGFDACGIARADASPRADFVRRWLDDGRHGEMHWLAQRFDERTDVRTYLPGAKSVVVVTTSYHVPLKLAPLSPTAGRIARYALGDDYHDHLKRKLHSLADWLRGESGCETRACVDTAPILESEWAARAGVAWQGKNRLALDTKLGSYLLLGELVTTAELEPDEAAVDRCGTCTRCLDACPTDALRPYEIDPRRCISYWTIEHRGSAKSIPPDMRRGIGDWLFGCDVCQEVCPWNGKAEVGTDAALAPRPALATGTLDAAEVASWTPEQYRQTLRGSAMKRTKLPQLQRNARIVLENAQAT